MNLLDFFFPKYCVNCKKLGEYLCSNCFSYIAFANYSICAVCSKNCIDGLTHPGCRGKYLIDGAFSSLSYKGVVKKLIYTFKYKPFLSDLKTVLSDLLLEGLIQQEEFDKAYKENPLIVPIPIYQSRLRNRGYNQASILAKELAKRLSLPFAEALVRTRNTRSQVGLKKKDRSENVRAAFSLSSSYDIVVSQYPNIFLVDDVVTTGSTLLEAASVLKRNGAKKVWGITLAQD